MLLMGVLSAGRGGSRGGKEGGGGRRGVGRRGKQARSGGGSKSGGPQALFQARQGLLQHSVACICVCGLGIVSVKVLLRRNAPRSLCGRIRPASL